MKRHIKVRAKLIPPLFNKVEFCILEQSHKDYDLSNESCCFTASNGVRLESCACPEWSVNTLFVRGYNSKLDDKRITIPSADWPRIRQALEEYNKWGATQ